MTAVEKALRHIEQLQRRLIKAVPSKPRKPAKRRTAPKKRVDQGPRLAKQLTRLATKPYTPPVTHPDFTELREAFAPTPSCEVSVTAEGTKLVPPLPFVTGGVRPSSRRHPPQRRAPRRRQGGCLCLS